MMRLRFTAYTIVCMLLACGTTYQFTTVVFATDLSFADLAALEPAVDLVFLGLLGLMVWSIMLAYLAAREH